MSKMCPNISKYVKKVNCLKDLKNSNKNNIVAFRTSRRSSWSKIRHMYFLMKGYWRFYGFILFSALCTRQRHIVSLGIPAVNNIRKHGRYGFFEIFMATINYWIDISWIPRKCPFIAPKLVLALNYSMTLSSKYIRTLK